MGKLTAFDLAVTRAHRIANHTQQPQFVVVQRDVDYFEYSVLSWGDVEAGAYHADIMAEILPNRASYIEHGTITTW